MWSSTLINRAHRRPAVTNAKQCSQEGIESDSYCASKCHIKHSQSKATLHSPGNRVLAKVAKTLFPPSHPIGDVSL